MPNIYIKKYIYQTDKDYERYSHPVYIQETKREYKYVGLIGPGGFLPRPIQIYDGDCTDHVYCRQATEEEMLIIQVSLL